MVKAVNPAHMYQMTVGQYGDKFIARSPDGRVKTWPAKYGYKEIP